MLQRTRGGKDRDADDVNHKQGDALNVNDKDFPRERGDSEKCRTDQKDLDDDDEEEGLKEAPEMVGANSRLVCPGSERPQPGAEHQAGEGEDGGHKRAGPASAEVGEFRNGFGEQDLVGVALEIAQDGGAEDGRHDDNAKEGGRDVVESVREGRVQENLAIAVADRTKIFGGDTEKGKRGPDHEVDVGGEALEAELKFEGEELPEQRHVRILQQDAEKGQKPLADARGSDS